MNRERISPYAWRCAPWTVCGVRVGDRAIYELWHDKQPDRVGGEFENAKAARDEAGRIEQAGQA